MRKPYKYEELEDPVDLVIHTKSPSKWLLIDRETGETYEGNDLGKWDKLKTKKENEK